MYIHKDFFYMFKCHIAMYTFVTFVTLFLNFCLMLCLVIYHTIIIIIIVFICYPLVIYYYII